MNSKNILFSIILSAIFLASCSDAPSSVPSDVNGVIEPQKGNQQKKLEELENSPVAAKKNNLTSALRFTETYERTNVWGILLRMSKWSKEVHAGNFIVLAPSNDALRGIGLDLIAELKYKENKDLLDKLMAKHIIKTSFNVEKMEHVPELETIDGQKWSVDALNANIEGVRYNIPQFQTEHGAVVVLDGVIDLPKQELKVAANKRNNSKLQ